MVFVAVRTHFAKKNTVLIYVNPAAINKQLFSQLSGSFVVVSIFPFHSGGLAAQRFDPQRNYSKK